VDCADLLLLRYIAVGSVAIAIAFSSVLVVLPQARVWIQPQRLSNFNSNRWSRRRDWKSAPSRVKVDRVDWWVDKGQDGTSSDSWLLSPLSFFLFSQTPPVVVAFAD
jgi:hypothetical protein